MTAPDYTVLVKSKQHDAALAELTVLVHIRSSAGSTFVRHNDDCCEVGTLSIEREQRSEG